MPCSLGIIERVANDAHKNALLVVPPSFGGRINLGQERSVAQILNRFQNRVMWYTIEQLDIAGNSPFPEGITEKSAIDQLHRIGRQTVQQCGNGNHFATSTRLEDEVRLDMRTQLDQTHFS